MVRNPPRRGWTAKAYKEREIPIPNQLVVRLTSWKASRADENCVLAFPTSGCNVLACPDCLNAVAGRADMDEDNFCLHKLMGDIRKLGASGERSPHGAPTEEQPNADFVRCFVALRRRGSPSLPSWRRT